MARALGLDFGTANAVLALTGAGVGADSLTSESRAGTSYSMCTPLPFVKAGVGEPLKVEAGQAAIRLFIDNPGDCRFLQSIKTFAASVACSILAGTRSGCGPLAPGSRSTSPSAP